MGGMQAYRRRAAETERMIDASVAEVKAARDADWATLKHKGTHCAVCDVQVFKTRDPRKHVCTLCQRVVCGRHILFYVDDVNAAINRAARGKCPECWDGNA